MSINVLSEPGSYSLSKNQIPLILQSDSFLEVQGAYSAHGIEMVYPIPNQHKLLISLKGLVHEFVFVNDGSNITSCNQIYRNNTSAFGNPEDWIVVELIPKLRKNYYLEKYFNFVFDDPALLINAKQKGSEFNLTVTAIDTNNNPSTAFSISHNSVGTNRKIKENYKLYTQVFIANENNNAFILAGEAEANVNESGIAEFDLSSILHSFLSASLAEHNAANLVEIKKSNRIFYYLFGEKYGSPVRYYCHSTPSDNLYEGKRVLFAGIDTEDFGRNKLNNFSSAMVGLAKKPLSFLQDLYIPRSVPEVFASILNNLDTSIRVEATGFNAANQSLGSSASGNFAPKLGATASVKLKSLFNGIFANSNVAYITFRFRSQFDISRFSDWFNVFLIDKPFLNIRYFAFRNSFGVYEVFFATEAENQTIKVDDTQNFERQLPVNYNANNVQFGVTDKLINQEFEINTGYIGINPNQDARSYSNRLKAELLLTTDLFVYNNNAWHPVVITSKNFGIPNPQNTDFGFTLKYQYAYNTASPMFNDFL